MFESNTRISRAALPVAMAAAAAAAVVVERLGPRALA
jgi:hypothetical protein